MANSISAGLRRCPNMQCKGLVFVIIEDKKHPISIPGERIEIDPTNIPASLLSTLKEAADCHAAGAYRAAALMIRRLLEELCEAQGIEGNSLNERLSGLRGKIIISDALIKGAQRLRLMGNDAAHVSAKTYVEIGKAEVELATDVAKKILEAVYQHDDLVSRLEKIGLPSDMTA